MYNRQFWYYPRRAQAPRVAPGLRRQSISLGLCKPAHSIVYRYDGNVIVHVYKPSIIDTAANYLKDALATTRLAAAV
jgi:hypothetical protein